MGLLAIALPVTLAVFGFILCDCIEIQDSISDYYSLRTRDVLVGILLAVAVFLFAYQGYPRTADDPKLLPTDNFFGRLACVFAIGVAYFPNSGDNLDQIVHFVSSAGMFLVLAYFSLFLFTKTVPGGTSTGWKRTRNVIYVACGLAILACIALIVVNNLAFDDTSLADIKPVFWLESLALWAFGISWLVKGGFSQRG